MRKQLMILTLITGSMLVMSGCGSFPTSYNKIESNRVRVLDFIFEPAEAAPGDTVTMTTIFAGKPLDLDDIEWSVHYKVLTNNYSVERRLDSVPLDIINIAEADFSDRSQAWDVTFIVPNWVLADNPAIPEDLLSLLPNEEVINAIPDEIKPYLKKSAALPLLESLAAKAPTWKIALANGKNDSLLANDSLFAFYMTSGIGDFLPVITQLFSIKSYIMTDITTSHMVESEYIIRYNTKLEGLPGSKVFSNNNPRIDSIGLYIVKEPNLVTYNPEEKRYPAEFLRLDRPEGDTTKPIIEVDRSNSYFLIAYTDNPDTVMTLDAIFNPKVEPGTEDYIHVWYFMLDSQEVENVSYKKYMNIGNLGKNMAHLYPPAAEEITSFTIWLEVRDGALNERFRPVASALKEIRGKFRYSEN